MEYLTIAAFILSILSLLGTLWLTWVRWPRVTVEIDKPARFVIDTDPELATDPIRVIVVNHGSEALTIRNIGLRQGPNADYELTGFNVEQFIQDGLPLPAGAELPVRLEGNGCLVWVFDKRRLTPSRRDFELVAYAERYGAILVPFVRRAKSRKHEHVSQPFKL